MKNPQKTPPTEQQASSTSGNEPQINVTESLSTALNDPQAPTIEPSGSASAYGDAFGAAVWQSDKRVNGLYTTHHARNSWMSIVGIGWVKLATSSDSACEAMTILAGNARAKNTRIDYSVDAGLVNEIYVW